MRHGLFQLRRYLEALVTSLTGSALVPRRVRARLLGLLGMRVPGAVISPGCVFEGRKVAIGGGTFVGHRCHFDAAEQVTVGARCGIGTGTRFITSTHKIGPSGERGGERYALPITVAEGVWIGAAVTVLPGVTIAPGCILAAGAVVTRSTEPDGLYAGVPARRVRDL